MIILVDVDGVVADLHSGWLKLYNEDYNDNLRPEDITAWEMKSFVKCGDKIYDYLTRPELYDFVKPISGAKETIKALRKAGHKVVFLTAGFYPAKVKWLHDNGFLQGHNSRWQSAEDVVIAFDKSLIKGDWMIDDRPENLLGFSGIRLLFDQPWNRSYPMNVHNVMTGWEEIREVFGVQNGS